MRPPDLIIGPRDNPQTLRWHLIKFRGWQFALHKWMRSDDDRALHDHIGHNISFILSRAGYMEVVRERVWDDDEDAKRRRPDFEQFRLTHAGDGEFYRDVDTWHYRRPWWPYFRRADEPHRVALLLGSAPVWTLWLRWPPIREWGFHCPRVGWRHWKEYCDMRDGKGGQIGRGCD